MTAFMKETTKIQGQESDAEEGGDKVEGHEF